MLLVDFPPASPIQVLSYGNL